MGFVMPSDKHYINEIALLDIVTKSKEVINGTYICFTLKIFIIVF